MTTELTSSQSLCRHETLHIVCSIVESIWHLPPGMTEARFPDREDGKPSMGTMWICETDGHCFVISQLGTFMTVMAEGYSASQGRSVSQSDLDEFTEATARAQRDQVFAGKLAVATLLAKWIAVAGVIDKIEMPGPNFVTYAAKIDLEALFRALYQPVRDVLQLGGKVLAADPTVNLDELLSAFPVVEPLPPVKFCGVPPPDWPVTVPEMVEQ
ncbi:hypothetical protein [Pseudooceanicola sp. LIPI14-2-Ac024]|uniref:hypothetical protein n=1 Tax=Pseudooceanicola sp. LIPI14-2-Ac024 TaxID=3344875 RepID=UPI0035CF42C4